MFCYRALSTQVHCFAPDCGVAAGLAAGVPPAAPQPGNALHAACARGDASLALSVLSQSFLNAQDDEGETPAMKAAKAGSIRTLELLIKARANFEISDSHGWTVLHWCVQAEHAEIVATILDYAPVLLNVRDKRGLTPLHVAAWIGNPVLVRRLLAEGADVHAVTEWGETPLHMAVFFGHFETSEILLSAGASPSREDRMKRTPVGLAQDERIKQLFAQSKSS